MILSSSIWSPLNWGLSVSFLCGDQITATYSNFRRINDVYVCVYLPSCSIQSLTYTRMVLSPYLCVCVCVCVYFYLVGLYRDWATLVWSCLCPVFPSVDVHSLPLSPLPSLHSKYLYFFGWKLYFFVSFKQIFLQVFLVSPQISSLPFSSQY